MSYSLPFGFLPLPWWGYVLLTLVLTQITIFSVTLFLHRGQAHRSLELHPIVSHFCRFWLWLTTGMETKAWAAIHRKHHARVETEEDPHSPQKLGIWKVLLEGAELYRKEAKNKETLERYGAGTPDDWLERRIYSPHSAMGILIMLIIDLVLFGTVGLTIWAIQMAWIPFFAAGVVNGLGHFVGYRNYESQDASRNLLPWGLFIGGEELHNNHHAYGTSAKFSTKWWEFDIGWLVIRLLQCAGLAKPKRAVPKLQQLPGKAWVDVETVKALIVHRLHVMAMYAREVTLPVWRQQTQLSAFVREHKNILKRAYRLLVSDDSALKETQRSLLKRLLENVQSLNVVYQFRVRLQRIWNDKTATQQELLDALSSWCKEAEATGIEVLAQFSRRLKSYAA